MSGPRPNRRWLQVHLSTAVLLMLVVGAVMYANIFFSPGAEMPDTLYDSATVKNILKTVPAEEGSITFNAQYGWVGWPITFRRVLVINDIEHQTLFYDSLGIDVGCGIAILIG